MSSIVQSLTSTSLDLSNCKSPLLIRKIGNLVEGWVGKLVELAGGRFWDQQTAITPPLPPNDLIAGHHFHGLGLPLLLQPLLPFTFFNLHSFNQAQMWVQIWMCQNWSNLNSELCGLVVSILPWIWNELVTFSRKYHNQLTKPSEVVSWPSWSFSMTLKLLVAFKVSTAFRKTSQPAMSSMAFPIFPSSS